MGGHGAITLGLKYPHLFKSISAFSPICSPINCPWGEKAFSSYLGNDKEEWKQHDSVELLEKSKEKIKILIDQGLDDEFYEEQLNTPLIEEKATQINYPLEVRKHEGYDHSYYFISTFINDHLDFHHQAIN